MSQDIEKVIQDIAKIHNISIGRDDPILILYTINEMLLKRATEAQENQLKAFQEEIQLSMKQLSEESKDKAEKVISAALNASRANIERATSEQIDSFNNQLSKTLNGSLIEFKTILSNESAKGMQLAKFSMIASIFALASSVIVALVTLL
ncbi:conjugal transfer protein TraM (plasmid) [Shewanella sp. LC6]|uniref:conjugal transfer protein TraM n=1 Tax=Shewanella TaxID=22 RepID=UPI000B49F5AF|nr:MULTISPECIES: conjugal transfer protein TraM [unclassified Shewanella]QQK62477.1 conjugal transfer protein TraM [Shewanella sp. LC6]TPE56195.1 conjugal transfer protein TraM [Shewanella sp. LC2]